MLSIEVVTWWTSIRNIDPSLFSDLHSITGAQFPLYGTLQDVVNTKSKQFGSSNNFKDEERQLQFSPE